MRWLSFKNIVAGVIMISLAFSDGISADCKIDSVAQDSDVHLSAYQKRIIKRENRWQKLIPEMYTLQYAGGIGLLSAGMGWNYGPSDQWETHLLFGFLPKRYRYPCYFTFTLKETYSPWRVRLSQQWNFKPLSVSLSVNSVLHSDFWTSQPDRYPKGYYGFSSRIRFHLSLGQRFTYIIPEYKRLLGSQLSVYYEVSSCDLYIRQKILNSSIPLKDIIILGFGIIYTI